VRLTKVASTPVPIAIIWNRKKKNKLILNLFLNQKAITLEGKIFNAVNNFFTGSPLAKEIRQLMVGNC